MIWLFFIVIGFIALIIALIAKPPNKNYVETDAYISRITDGSYGRVMFYVSFIADNSEWTEAQTEYYHGQVTKFSRGDKVRIRYYRKNGEIMNNVLIDDPDIIPSSAKAKKYFYLSLFIGVGFIILGIIFLIVYITNK